MEVGEGRKIRGRRSEVQASTAAEEGSVVTKVRKVFAYCVEGKSMGEIFSSGRRGNRREINERKYLFSRELLNSFVKKDLGMDESVKKLNHRGKE